MLKYGVYHLLSMRLSRYKVLGIMVRHPFFSSSSSSGTTMYMKNGQAHCRDETANHYLPTPPAVFFLLHPSAGEELRYVTSMRSKVSSDWLPSYIMATRPFFEIFKMAGYFRDRPRTCCILTRKPEEAIWTTQRYMGP